MIGQKTERNKEEKKESIQIRIDKEKKKENKKGRKKKEISEEEKKQIMEEVEEELNKYLKPIELDENNFTPYSLDEILNIQIKNDKPISRMLQVYIHKLNEDENNKTYEIINFSKNFKKIITYLNMSENEFSFFTILLDKIGLKHDNNFDIFEHLYYLGILSMQYTTGKFLNRINDKFIKWKKDINLDENMIKSIGIIEMNNRKNELTISDKDYDSEKYIDYNQLVDDILKEAHFYKE